MSHLNNLGPKVISMEMLERYKALPPPNGKRWTVMDMFYYWIDEANPDALRLLTLRDLLRQDGIPHAAKHSDEPEEELYRYTHGDYKQIYFKNGKPLKRALAGRPKLANELAKELLYNLDHHLMCRSAQLLASGAGDECDHLIELLLPRVNQKMAQELWKYHSCNPDHRPLLNEDKTFYLVGKLLMSRHSPAWLTKKLWHTVSEKATAECKLLPQDPVALFFTDNKDRFCRREYITLIALIRRLQQIYDQPKHVDNTIKLINLLENCFPKNYAYIDFHNVARIAPAIHDATLTTRFLFRHLDALDSSTPIGAHIADAHDALNFLYWAKGCVEHAILLPNKTSEHYNYIVRHLIQTTKKLDYLPVY